MKAPFDGVVSAVFETQGAVVNAGKPILRLSAEDEREAVIDLPEPALAGLPPTIKKAGISLNTALLAVLMAKEPMWQN